MRTVTAPTCLTARRPGDGAIVFLAGGITGCPDWQAEALELLGDTDLVVCNPRQPAFDVTNPDAAFNQITWEVQHLRTADLILFWFPASGDVAQPIALFELGMALGRRRDLVLGADPDYCRRYDVKWQSFYAAQGRASTRPRAVKCGSSWTRFARRRASGRGWSDDPHG